MVFNMRIIIIILLSICLSHVLYSRDHADRVEAYVSFEKEKIWFRVYSKEIVFLSLEGSVLNADNLISRNERINLQAPTAGSRWFLGLDKNKPQIQGGVKIFNYSKLKKMIREKKKIRLEMVKVFKINKEGEFSGPYVVAPSYIREVDLERDLTTSSLLFRKLEK